MLKGPNRHKSTYEVLNVHRQNYCFMTQTKASFCVPPFERNLKYFLRLQSPYALSPSAFCHLTPSVTLRYCHLTPPATLRYCHLTPSVT